MRLKILYGRAGCGKTYNCIDRIKELTGRGERCVMIVPEQFSYITEKLLVERLGAASGESAEVLTFTRLAARIFSALGGIGKLPLSAAGKNMLIYRALVSVKKNLKIYENAAEKTGFTERVASVISEFKRYGVSADDICEVAQNISNDYLSAKLSDIAFIYKKYDELFLEDYIDFEDNLYMASEKLKLSGCLDNIHIFIDEFSDFLPQHYKMIEQMSGSAKDITVCLCADKNLDRNGVFSPAAKTFFKLKNMCQNELKIEFECEYTEGNKLHADNEEMLHFEKNYTKIKPEVYISNTQNIKISRSLNLYDETEYAARRILEMVREKNARWRDICVCCSDADSYFEIVKIIFERYNIPCFISQKSAASDHPLVLTLLSAIDIFVKGFSYESVFTYLKTGYSNISMEETDRLENYVLATGIGKKAWLDEKVWSYKSSLGEQICENEEIDTIRRKVIKPLMELRENIGSKHSARHACEAIYNFLNELDMYKKVSKMVEMFKAEGDFVSANRYGRIWNCILNVLDQVVLTTGDKKIGMKQLKNLLEAGFSNEQIGIIPQFSDAVSVVSVSDARAQNCDYMFALGTNTGDFMLSSVSEGVLSDSDREIIKQQGLDLAPTAREASFDTRFLLYKVLMRPKMCLYLSCSVSKISGESLPESDVCRAVKNIFENVLETDNIIETEPNEALLTSPMATFGEMAANIDTKKNSDGFWSEVRAWYEKDEYYNGKVKQLKRAKLYSNTARPLSPSQVEKLYPYGLSSSASRLERYSSCPFSYFIEYTLRAKERKIAKIGAPDIGSIMHKVIERFTKQIEEEKLSWHSLDDEYVEGSVAAIVDEICLELFKGSAFEGKATSYLIQRLKHNLIRCCKLLIMHIVRGVYEPVGSEVHFGEGGDIRAVVIDLTSGKKMRIHGVIDRLDAYKTENGTYYRVIDYKSGSKSFSFEGIYNGIDLQLAVYMDAALSSDENATPAAMLYFNIREPMITLNSAIDNAEAERLIIDEMKLDGLVLNDEEVIRDMDRNYLSGSEFLPVKINKNGTVKATSSLATMHQFNLLINHVKSTMKKIGNDILKGKIDIMPYRNAKGSPCDYCEYKIVCKFDPKKSGYRNCESVRATSAWEIFEKAGGGRNEVD